MNAERRGQLEPASVLAVRPSVLADYRHMPTLRARGPPLEAIVSRPELVEVAVEDLWPGDTLGEGLVISSIHVHITGLPGDFVTVWAASARMDGERVILKGDYTPAGGERYEPGTKLWVVSGHERRIARAFGWEFSDGSSWDVAEVMAIASEHGVSRGFFHQARSGTWGSATTYEALYRLSPNGESTR